jgi:hypothetical protein
MQDIREVVKFVLSCCILHEICLVNSDEFDEYIQDGLNANSGKIPEVLEGCH